MHAESRGNCGRPAFQAEALFNVQIVCYERSGLWKVIEDDRLIEYALRTGHGKRSLERLDLTLASSLSSDTAEELLTVKICLVFALIEPCETV